MASWIKVDKMPSELIKGLKESVLASLPEETKIASVDFEGPEVAIYTRNPKAFFENENYVAKLAFDLKKRVNIRCDKSLLLEEDKAKDAIMRIVPPDAQITEILFNTAFNQVTIESIKPGLVIGKGGETSKKIIMETGWTPEILRAPTAPSEILRGIRQFLHKHSAERKKILQETAEKIYREFTPPQNQWIRLTGLGGFRQVGRSCVFVETNDTKVIGDCGINVASKDEPYPYLDAIRFPMNELDAVIVTHAHLDHSGFVPYLYKMGYRGPTYCTLPTRDLMCLLGFDYIDVLTKEGKEPPYGERDVKEMVKHCIPRDFREVTDIAPDMRMTLHNAAHILGSSSVHLHIGDGAHNLVYSGDIKYGFTRLFDVLDIKYPRLETLIVEATYGGKENAMPERQDSEERLLKIVNDTIAQGGNVLIPVFAVGRAQEMMLVLENFYRQGMLKAKCYIDGMTKEASAIHTAYPEHMKSNVQRRILTNDSPFTSNLFQIASHENRDAILAERGAIIMASSGMLTGGPSLDYFYRMAEDPTSTLVFVGWQGEGSLGRKLQSGIKSIPIPAGNGKTRELKINMRIEVAEGFSGHSDKIQLINYIRSLKPKPKRIFANHGDKNSTIEFSRYVTSRLKIHCSAIRNLDSVRLK